MEAQKDIAHLANEICMKTTAEKEAHPTVARAKAR